MTQSRVSKGSKRVEPKKKKRIYTDRCCVDIQSILNQLLYDGAEVNNDLTRLDLVDLRGENKVSPTSESSIL